MATVGDKKNDEGVVGWIKEKERGWDGCVSMREVEMAVEKGKDKGEGAR